jgi:hypothetical protein
VQNTRATIERQTAPEAAAETDMPATAETGADPSAISAKLVRYVKRIFDRYDRNGNSRLEQNEWSQMRGEPHRADRDGDGILQVDEFIQHVAEYGRQRKIRLLPPQPGDLVELPPLLMPTSIGDSNVSAEELPQTPADTAETEAQSDTGIAEPARKPEPEALRRRDTKFYAPSSRIAGLPAAFLTRDRDGDGQLTLSEFAPKQDKASLDEFARYDRDSDGVVTAAEYLDRTAPP